MVAKRVETVEAKIEREAEEIIRMGGLGSADIFDRLDQYNDRFKQ